MLTWKSVAPDICDMLFSMPPNMFVFGVLHSRPILKRSAVSMVLFVLVLFVTIIQFKGSSSND